MELRQWLYELAETPQLSIIAKSMGFKTPSSITRGDICSRTATLRAPLISSLEAGDLFIWYLLMDP